jgi:hypothetical protein
VDAELRVIGERVRDERNGRFQHVDLDAAALAGPLALVERAEHPVGGIHAGDIVRDGRSVRLRIFGVEKQAGIPERKADTVIPGARCYGPTEAAIEQ